MRCHIAYQLVSSEHPDGTLPTPCPSLQDKSPTCPWSYPSTRLYHSTLSTIPLSIVTSRRCRRSQGTREDEQYIVVFLCFVRLCPYTLGRSGTLVLHVPRLWTIGWNTRSLLVTCCRHFSCSRWSSTFCCCSSWFVNILESCGSWGGGYLAVISPNGFCLLFHDS